ncbi:PREDICTED: GDSL esterase/lipase At5g03610-like isoform X1 [Lupinus angustifolius]|uniref:GDSL esterase/lipase At5g03610-like isoform X1 n=1 Tax=Lupinus angustifolius TaxID=3871 RepID=UPI00092E59DE|nr:PREDICTED: GDSL esterase/lipase At5g03610-like isoform X1 [Lupinus angustifolius]
MVKQNQSIMALLLLFLILAISAEVEGAKKSYGMYNNDNNSVKLFVFGDSYVDTGNFIHSGAYKPPSGMTFPGYPAGRFGNGRIITDYLASFLNIESPTPFVLRNSSNLQNGVNFAYGGTGIFKTLVDGPNLTIQIDSFEQLIKQNVYSKTDLESSIVLVNAGANDYTTFILKDRNIFEIHKFMKSLVDEMIVSLIRIHNLGAKKIVVSLLQPIGCLPTISVASLYIDCIDLFNLVSRDHNKMILGNLEDLNKEIGKPIFRTLDLYNSFLSAIRTIQKKRKENSTLINPLEPCCALGSVGYDCGKVDEKGEKKYTLCEKPELSFFWDNAHPSQNGWYSVFMQLESSLGQIFGKNL